MFYYIILMLYFKKLKYVVMSIMEWDEINYTIGVRLHLSRGNIM